MVKLKLNQNSLFLFVFCKNKVSTSQIYDSTFNFFNIINDFFWQIQLLRKFMEINLVTCHRNLIDTCIHLVEHSCNIIAQVFIRFHPNWKCLNCGFRENNLQIFKPLDNFLCLFDSIIIQLI